MKKIGTRHRVLRSKNLIDIQLRSVYSSATFKQDLIKSKKMFYEINSYCASEFHSKKDYQEWTMKCKSWAALGILIIVFALTACSKSDSGNSTSYSISGTVTLSESALQGVTITLSGTSAATTTTDASGNYSFANLSPGTYTVTPSLAGYTYLPSSPTVTISNASQAQNFTATSAITSYSISGTISYSGSHTGRIYVGLKNQDSNATWQGTSIPSPGAFTIRGIMPGTYYKLSAEMDIRGDGTLNADNPSGEILTITVSSGNLTNQNVILTDPAPATPVTPTGLTISPGNGAAIIRWNVMMTNYKVIAESYKIYWGTDNAATNGTPITVQANHDVYMQSITNGVYYYKISALVGTTESAPSAVVGPVTIGAGTGLNTVSGTVTIPVTPTGPLYVGVAGNGIYYFTKIASPTTSQTYSVSGVPNGTYRSFAILDQNNNGLMGIGKPKFNTIGTLPILINNNNQTEDITISAANAFSYVATDHWTNGSSSGYTLNFEVFDMMKLPVQVSLFSGQNISVPMDMQRGTSINEFFYSHSIHGVRPALTDSYGFDIIYVDGTTEQLTADVITVLDSFVQNPSVEASPSNVQPTFSWSAPASPPAFYSYNIAVNDSTTGNLIWNYTLPSTQTTVQYNTNGTASQASLTSGITYYCDFYLVDTNNNRTKYIITYTP